LASVQIASYNSHSASFGPSAVRVDTETVYSGRCEAGLVMTSIGSLRRSSEPAGLIVRGRAKLLLWQFVRVRRV
jgi:hypothetical protein